MPTVLTAVRVRPEEQANMLDPFRLSEQAGGISLTVGGQGHDFVFDHVFGQGASQEQVFSKCAVSICNDTLEGFNGTIFAYGQTGAGKTHTMSGPAEIENYERDCGLCMRTASHLFEKSRKMPHTVSIRLSVLEIYNESLVDLLQPPPESATGTMRSQSVQKLTVIEKPTGVSVPALRVMPLANEEDAFAFMLDAHHNRVVAEHQLNRASSRSHVLYTFYITVVKQASSDAETKGSSVHSNNVPKVVKGRARAQEDTEPEVIQSKLHLVDLAGSERGKKSGSDGMTMKEANYINKSLSYLEQVVVALTQTKREHIPYRQSKLTHLLKDSLGGNCHTALISCVWPHQNHAWETLSTLRFATRMKNIENTPVRNNLLKAGEATGGNVALVKQVNALKRELAMRDTIAGTDPALLELTVPQKSAIMKQACEIVGSHIPTHGHTASLFALLPPEGPSASPGQGMLAKSDQYYGNKMLQVDSLSHVHTLLGCLRAAVWEACDMDPAHVANVLDRTMDAFREAHHIDGAANTKSARAMPAFAHVEEREDIDIHQGKGGNSAGGGVGSPEQWIYPAGDVRAEGEYEGSLEGKDSANIHDSRDGGFSHGRQQEQPQGPEHPQVVGRSQSLNSDGSHGRQVRHPPISKAEDDAPAVLAGLREAANNNYPQTQPDPFNERAEEEASGILSAASSVPRLPALQGQGRGEDGAVPYTGDPSYVPSSQTMSFDEFKEGPGAELHRAYDELRQHLRTEKGRMRDITRMVNAKKAEIDQFASAILDLDAKNVELTKQNAKLETSLKESNSGSPEQTEGEASAPSMESPARSALADQRQSLVMRCEQTKAAYRAIHIEFQLCKKQIEETQLLKKRAMGDIVAAYERLATQNAKAL